MKAQEIDDEARRLERVANDRLGELNRRRDIGPIAKGALAQRIVDEVFGGDWQLITQVAVGAGLIHVAVTGYTGEIED